MLRCGININHKLQRNGIIALYSIGSMYPIKEAMVCMTVFSFP